MDTLKKSISWSPVTSLFGQRQTGKTTLLKALSESSETFDDLTLSESIERQGEAFFEGKKKPLLLDEVQKYPPLFDLIKKYVDQNKKPAQLLLTGSVRFSQRKDIRESLTGRTALWELLPLTTSERLETSFLSLWDLLSKEKATAFENHKHLAPSTVLKNYTHGGLPGICFLRSDQQRLQSIRNHVATLIERDLPLIRNVKISSAQLIDFLRLLVAEQGQNLNKSVLARKMRLSVPTVTQLLFAFEGLFLIRKVGLTYYFEDSGIASFLDPIGFSKIELLHWVFSELRAQWIYRNEQVLSFESYSTRGGAHIPFVVRLRKGQILGFVLENSNEIPEKAIKSLYSFQTKNPNARGILLYQGDELRVLKRNIWLIPFSWLA